MWTGAAARAEDFPAAAHPEAAGRGAVLVDAWAYAVLCALPEVRARRAFLWPEDLHSLCALVDHAEDPVGLAAVYEAFGEAALFSLLGVSYGVTPASSALDSIAGV